MRYVGMAFDFMRRHLTAVRSEMGIQYMSYLMSWERWTLNVVVFLRTTNYCSARSPGWQLATSTFCTWRNTALVFARSMWNDLCLSFYWCTECVPSCLQTCSSCAIVIFAFSNDCFWNYKQQISDRISRLLSRIKPLFIAIVHTAAHSNYAHKCLIVPTVPLRGSCIAHFGPHLYFLFFFHV